MYKERTILQMDAYQLMISFEAIFNKKVDKMMKKRKKH